MESHCWAEARVRSKAAKTQMRPSLKSWPIGVWMERRRSGLVALRLERGALLRRRPLLPLSLEAEGQGEGEALARNHALCPRAAFSLTPTLSRWERVIAHGPLSLEGEGGAS
jgi:hypothetical protein